MNAGSYFSLFKDRKIPVVFDEERTRGALCRLGFTPVHYDDYDFQNAKTPSFVMLTSLAYHARFMRLWNTLETVTTHVALAKFDDSAENIEYSMQQLVSIDYEDTLRRRAAYYQQVVDCGHIEVVTPGAVLTCKLGEAIELANDDVEMKPGWLYSTAEFLETSVVNLEGAGSSFSLTGRFSFDGIVYLFNDSGLRTEYGATFDALLRESNRGKNLLEYEDNVITRFVVGGSDRTAEFLAMVHGKERESAPSEFALGCVEYKQRQDWSRNSLLHESTHGVHIGVGMSRQIPHVDFIARGADCRFVA